MVLMSSFNAPIMVKGQFKGTVGVDLSLDFIQDLLKTADSQLYNGAGEMALISTNGRLVAYTKDPSKLGESASSVLDANEVANLAKLTLDQPLTSVDKEHGHIELFLPFTTTIADSGARWTLMLQLPQEAVLGDLNQLQTGNSDENIGRKNEIKNPMLVVTDIDKSVEFYKKVFGLHIIMDFGANKTLTGGLALQTVETYKAFIGTNDISFGGNNFELYFEEDDFDNLRIS